MPLNDEAARRYARHVLLPEIGTEGQARLLASSALVIGAGGLGAASISYLAAAGIGRIGIVDDDHVELSNLNRQILHETGDIGRLKTASAADRVEELTPECRVETYPARFESLDAAAILPRYDVVLDGSDTFATRFAVEAACRTKRRTLVSAAVRGFAGQISTFTPHLGAPHPCYRCLVPDMPHDEAECAARGVIGPLVGIMGSFQAMEAIKELLSVGRSLSGRLLRYDALEGRWAETRLSRDAECPYCGSHFP